MRRALGGRASCPPTRRKARSVRACCVHLEPPLSARARAGRPRPQGPRFESDSQSIYGLHDLFHTREGILLTRPKGAPLAPTGAFFSESRAARQRARREGFNAFPAKGPPCSRASSLSDFAALAAKCARLIAVAASEREHEGQQFAPANCRRALQGALAAATPLRRFRTNTSWLHFKLNPHQSCLHGWGVVFLV